MHIFTFRFIAVAVLACCGSLCAPVLAQAPVEVDSVTTPAPATIDGCQVIARIDGQVVLACEILWRVNRMLESNRDRISPDQYAAIRDQLMLRTLSEAVDTKLLYNEFRRNFPPENMPRIEENLRGPFEEKEVPRLMKVLGAGNQRELEQELSRLGSSLDDLRRTFNENVIASEWLRSKVKINEEVGPDEMVSYYQSHLSDYDHPAQARWEELTIRRDRFAEPREAYVTMAHLGNSAWRLAAANPAPATPIFDELAKANSDGFNAKDGGQYDWTTRGALKSTVIDEALFSLEVGQMSPILESDTGFHIVRVLERKPAGRQPFAEVQNNIREKLKDERTLAAREEYIDQLRKDARIWTVYTGNVSADVLMGRGPSSGQRR